jgi:hypothetical protein
MLLSPDLALAACRGLKTVTRRVITPKPPVVSLYTGAIVTSIECSWLYANTEPERQRYGFWIDDQGWECRYGGPGDPLRLLTTWAVSIEWNYLKPSELPKFHREDFWHAGLGEKPAWAGKSRPGRYKTAAEAAINDLINQHA